MAIVNTTNFLRWSDSVVSTDQPQLPHPYRKDDEGCPYMPVAYPTESMSFYINTENGFTNVGLGIADFADIQLDLVNAITGAVSLNIGAVSQHFLDAPGNTIFNIYSTFVIPASVNGMYYLRLRDDIDDAILLTSNHILVRNDKTQLDKETVYVKFRHDRFFYNIKYHELPGFYQQFRIHLNVLERQLDSDKEQYHEITTGKNRVSHNYISRFYRLEAYYFDDDSHEAAGIMVEHDHLEINGRLYTIKSAYKESPNIQSKYQKGEAEIWDEAFASANRC